MKSTFKLNFKGSQNCSIGGWGITNHSDPFGNEVMTMAIVPIVGYVTCKRKYRIALLKKLKYTRKIITGHHICAGPPETCLVR